MFTEFIYISDGLNIPNPEAALLEEAIRWFIDPSDNLKIKGKTSGGVVFDITTGSTAPSTDLTAVLAAGDTMADGQVIAALNGGGQLDLRNGADNVVLLDNDKGNFNKSWMLLDGDAFELSNETGGVSRYQAGSAMGGKFITARTDFGAFSVFDAAAGFQPAQQIIGMADNSAAAVSYAGVIGKVTVIGANAINVPAALDQIIVINGSNHAIDPILTDVTYMSNIFVQDAKDIVLDTVTGSKIATAPSQKLGLWGVTPVIQPSTTGTAAYAGGGGGGIDQLSTSDGGLGGNAYTMSDIVLGLKSSGILA